MNPGLVSAAAIVFVITVGFIKRVHIGILSLSAAFAIGSVYGLETQAIIASWPTNLFLLLFGVTALFGILRSNGTLDRLTAAVVWHCRHRSALLPVALFLLTAVLAALGPGNIATSAVLLPLALHLAQTQGLNPMLMITLIIAGANVGGLSPIAPSGLISTELGSAIGLNVRWSVFAHMALTGTLIAGGYYVLFRRPAAAKATVETEPVPPAGFNAEQKLSLLVGALTLAGILIGGWHVGLTALAGASLLLLLTPMQDQQVFAAIPWGTIVLLCGVAVLVSVVDELGGVTLISDFLASIMTERSAAAILVIAAGLLSLVSSASGVVMPTLIPVVPTLAEQLGGGVKPETLVSAIVIGSHMATIAPLSTLGALAVASLPKEYDQLHLFRNLFLLAILSVLASAVFFLAGLFG